MLGAVIASILLVGLVWALFGQTGDFEFLNLDDPSYTFNCAFVKDGLSYANVREAFTNVRHGGIWMPVTYISYMCDITLFGPGAGVHHLVNVAIHALNAVLLMWLLVALAAKNAKFAKSENVVFFVLTFLLVAFWAVHPQRAEAVAWIASRKELLCTTFILGGLLCWLRARRREGWGWIPAFIGTYACFILACMSKPTAMCFPFLVLAAEGIVRSWAAIGMRQSTFGDRQPDDIRQPPADNHHFTFYILHFTFALCLAAATGVLATYSQTHPEGYAVRALFGASLPWRLLNAIVAVGLYIFQMFIPLGIHLDYRAVPGGWPVHGALGLGVFALVVLGVVGAWWWHRRARRRTGQPLNRSWLLFVGAVGFWFFASLAPTLGIFGTFGDHARADRFLYLPAMVLPIAAMMLYGAAKMAALPVNADLTGKAAFQAAQTGILPVAGLAIVVALFFAAAYPVVASYRTDMTAFTRTLSIDPDNWRALAHIGEARCATGVPQQLNGNPQGIHELDAGIDMLRHSYVVKANDATAVKLVYALMCRGRAEDWDEILDVCAKFDPASDLSGRALEALGTAELKKRRWREAINHLWHSRNAAGRNYARADAELKLAFALHNGGRHEEAKKWFEWFRDRSGRMDLASRARQVLSVLEYSPRSMLFW